MQKPTFDPGLTQQYSSELRRALNKDGTFNVRRRGGSWKDAHPYLVLVTMSWPAFVATLTAVYLIVNLIFATSYFLLGPGQLNGVESSTDFQRFWGCFFFSSHTLTTVGYGSIAPVKTGAHIVATIESMVGLFAFAVGTSLLYGRLSKPSVRIAFSENAVIAPYQGGTSLQIRVLNKRSNTVTELDATILLMTVEGPPNARVRRYAQLKLEREHVFFFPLTWTIVHPIDETSPLYGRTHEDLKILQAELIVSLRGFDETFNQQVQGRNSYRYDEIIWNARFTPAFQIDEAGDMLLNIDQVSDFKLLD